MQDCQTHGGYLTQGDLAQYRVLERSPLALAYRGNTLLTNPPPSSGGALIAFTLALLEKGDWSQIPWGSPQHITALAQAMALTNTARRDGYDAHLHSADVAQRFLAPDHLQPYHHAFGNVLNKWGSTTHVSVLDREGNAASVTTSNGEGSAYVIPGTQIMLNNMLGEADLHPQGFHQWQPHQRISSMMAPTLVLEAGRPRLVLGSGGSNRIRTAIVQVVSNLLDFHLPLEEAVAAPRLHWEQGTLHLEPGYEADSLGATGSPQLEPLLETLCPWQQQNMFFGGVHAVARTADGGFSGAGDARRGGAMVMA